METAIRWSQSSTADEQRFLYVDIAGKGLKLCKVKDDGKRPVLSYDLLSQNLRLSTFLAFDWSPFNESLVATGLSTGEAAIYRVDDESQAPILFPVRNQRYCRAVAFSTQGLLASGLDKVRTDFCLNVWDVNQRLSSIEARGGSLNVEPLRKLASSEPISSIKFFKDRPDTLITGVKGRNIRIYDLREGNGNASLEFVTKSVHNVAVNPLDENYVASCNPNDGGVVSIWDRRAGSRFTSGTLSASENQQMSAALEYTDLIDPKTSIWGLRFSRTKRGTLAMLSSSGVFKAFELGTEYVSQGYLSSFDRTLGTDSANSYARPIYTKNTRNFPSPFPPEEKTHEQSRRVAAFDFLNMGTSNDAYAVTVLDNKDVALYSLPPPHRPMDLSSRSVLARAGRVQDEKNFRLIEPSLPTGMKISRAVESIRENASKEPCADQIPSSPLSISADLDQHQSPIPESHRSMSRREKREQALSVGTTGKPLAVEDALTWLSIARLRCMEGYLPSNGRNRDIISDDFALAEFWEWIDRARANSGNDSMVIHNIDMNYLGVFSVWNNRLGRSLGNRILTGVSGRSIDITSLIQDLVEELAIPEGKTCATSYLAHRQLCLRILGAAESVQDLEMKVQELVHERRHTKAAALALFQDETQLAHRALMKNKPTQAHKLLAMAIIGAPRGQLDGAWEETCAAIAKELTDPYSRAILALVSKGDWGSVIDEHTLPLRSRVEVALRWLPDDELTQWLRDETSEAIIHGDIEGVVLTGLDHSAMDLFQSYIRRFNDVQTPVLAMSHTMPRFISDPYNRRRFEAWRESYRRQINSWKAHLQRVKFDVESRRLASTWDGRQLFKPPAQQISLVCNYCTKPLSQQDPTISTTETSSVTSTTRSGMTGAPSEGIHATPNNPLRTPVSSGTVCPKCGRHMPRCGVCSLWLGSVDPMSKGSIAEDEKKRRDSRQIEKRTSMDSSAAVAAAAAAANNNSSKSPTAAVRNVDDLMKRFVVFCSNCNHGFHADHARKWFSKHRICPVAECNCICDR